MKGFRFRIASVLLLILYLGIAFAALKSATDAWSRALFGIALVAFLSAILLTVHRTGQRRAFWLGFSLFGWVYLGASLITPIEPLLPTTDLLARVGARWVTPAPAGLAVADFDNDGSADVLVSQASGPQVLYVNRGNGKFSALDTRFVVDPTPDVWLPQVGTMLPPALSPGSPSSFTRIGHSLFAIVFALFGGLISRFLASRGDRQEPNQVARP
jgi:hypothetical protein